MQKTVSRIYSDQGRGNTPVPPEQQVRQRLDQQCEGGLEEYDYRLGTSYRMAILSFFHNAFIFVITMATKQRLMVNLELGFVEIFILE